MIRIVFILPSFAAGGAERVVLTILSSLDRAEFSPSLIVLTDEGPLRNLVPPDIDIVNLARPRVRSALPALRRTLRALKPEIAFSTMAHLNLGLLSLKPLLPRRTRFVVREANTPLAGLGGAKRWVGRIGYRRRYAAADAVLCPASRIAAEVTRVAPAASGRILTIPNPVDVQAIRRRAQPVQRRRGRGLRLVASGRMTHQKGFDRLIGLFPALAPEAHLTILGDGPDRRRLGALAQKLGVADRVAMPGFCENPMPIVAGADAFVLPSRWEGLPNVVLEALACGTRVVATPEAGGVDDIAAAAPGAVSLAEFHDPFVEALNDFKPKPDANRLPESLLPAQFELGAVVARYEELFQKILA